VSFVTIISSFKHHHPEISDGVALNTETDAFTIIVPMMPQVHRVVSLISQGI
jgi:hypothetical protein